MEADLLTDPVTPEQPDPATRSDERDAGSEPPPRGWQLRDQAPEPQAVAELLQKLVELLPPDLQQQLADALTQLFEAIKALIDWWVARLEQRASAPVAVRDIPIL